MREVAERFISGEDRKLATAKHLAHYVLALTEEQETVSVNVTVTDAEAVEIAPDGWVRFKITGHMEEDGQPDGELFVLGYVWEQLPRPGEDLPGESSETAELVC